MPETIKLAEELIRFRTDHSSELEHAVGFVTGWLGGQGIDFEVFTHEGLPVLVAYAGPEKYEQKEKSDIIFHAHLDVVPGKPEQFEPVIAEGRLYGRGAYDMKGALAAMMTAVAELNQDSGGHRVLLAIVPDEERARGKKRASQFLVERGCAAPFVICGEPTNLDVGVQAKGVLVLRIKSFGKSAHGSTPWLGENAILKSLWLYRRINRLPFARERSSVFDGPSINLGHISGGDVLNKVPDSCVLGLDIRYLPTQYPHEIVRQIRNLASDSADVEVLYQRPPAVTDPDLPYVRALLRAVKVESATSAISVGRDGSSDVIYFLEKGFPGVEFGPKGANHHGDDEYVEVESLTEYERILVHFVRNLEELGAEPGGKGWFTMLTRLRRLFRTGRRSF
jgi:succinyl-diaminopimelate desuccinylase